METLLTWFAEPMIALLAWSAKEPLQVVVVSTVLMITPVIIMLIKERK